MHVLYTKSKEVLFSILPITGLVFFLHLTITPIDSTSLIRFFVGAFLVVIGLIIFLLGVDIGIAPIGNSMGATVARTNKLWIVIASGLILGFFISVAEPDLHILADQVDMVTSGVIGKWLLVVVVSIGVAILVSIGLARIVYNISLRWLLLIFYGIILILAIVSAPEFLAIAFDASGATTGALTVPFILALGFGISRLKKDSVAAEEDSFGLIGMASLGAIIALLVMSMFFSTDSISGSIIQPAISTSIFLPFLYEIPIVAKEIFIALVPIVLIFSLVQLKKLHMSKRSIRGIMFGVLFTFVGLVLFLVGVNAGFMDVGRLVGQEVASLSNNYLIVGIGFILGVFSILAEPAVYVLTHQIEDVTSGSVNKRVVILTLALGVGLAMILSMLRILIPSLSLWQFLLPGYALALGLMFFVPKLFIGIAFDSGGVASGPITATFILAYTQGVTNATAGANALVDGFGMIAMVAMTPLIALQLLGLFYKIKSKKEVHN